MNISSAVPAGRATGSAATGSDGRSTRWDEHRQQRRTELIRATRAAVHELGPDVSMDEIALHAGTSKSVFYRYFGDKNGLQRAVGERSIHYMERELLTAADNSDHALEGLYNMVEAYLRLADSSPNVYAFATSIPQDTPSRSTPDDEDAAPMDGFFQRIGSVMDLHYRNHLRQIGREPSPESTAWYWPHGAMGMVKATGEAWLATPPASGRPDLQRMARTLTTWLVEGLNGYTGHQATSSSHAHPPTDTMSPVAPRPLPTPRQES